MPATIHIESGISAGTSAWIDRPVLRIGSNPRCEICLPTADLPPQVLTLEFRNGNYHVYNRATTPITVGAAAVAPGASEVWHANQSIHLPGDLQLLLETDGDPRPCPQPDAWVGNDRAAERLAPRQPGEGATNRNAAPKKSSNKLVQWAVIGVCVLGTAALLTVNRDAETAPPDRPSFEAIVEASLAAEDGGFAKEFLPRLQYAQTALVRGRHELARERFSDLRDQLVRLDETFSDEGREISQQMLDYVNYRLSTLP